MKFLTLGLVIFGFCNSFSQIQNVEIITKKNDTIKNVELKMGHISKSNLEVLLQEKITYLDKQGDKVKLLPTDVSSFSFTYDNEVLRFENIQDRGFALEMYSNKLKLFRVKTNAFNVYIIKKSDGKVIYMEAKGLSRLISKKEIAKAIPDCQSTLQKVEDKTLTIQGEAGVIELVKDYEMNCN
ncbi:hypothetical protein [Flavobacterium dankookense]|uniref:Uncharacterized protein n=1 Tax=Flavobacterium dankookense TaxID=706186 RepID=A0A4R6QAS4_9FLAO|nr:hypothetical protein [Flavobacterium dankookense]TDP59461.1 hypothetical protein BC748_1713 [Flavobacterium dankookense]